ncbi:hypothetical protein B0H34DRAFT_856891 [Crassisporium funariophilum]|nr:hypothetical protein B0H34DRAFT_856891 [Crassisporium funariophilum]
MAHHQPAPRPNYVHDIPSVRAVNPGLPDVLGNLDLDRCIRAGTPLEPLNLSQAKLVAKGLQAAHDYGIDDRVTAAVAESAALRATAVEAAHALGSYAPVDIGQALGRLAQQMERTNDRLDEMNERFAEMNKRFAEQLERTNAQLDVIVAFSHNTRLIASNSRAVAQQYVPLHKTVPGNGLQRAIIAFGNVGPLQQVLVAPAQEPVLGTIPPNYDHNLLTYNRADFVRLIIFYNQDFGIVRGDTIPECIEKLHTFSTRY